MTNKPQGPQKGPSKPAPESGEKKPSALIDLKATEIPPKDDKASEPAAAKPEAAKPQDKSAAASETKPVETSAKSSELPGSRPASMPPSASIGSKPAETLPPKSGDTAGVGARATQQDQAPKSASPQKPAEAGSRGGVGRILTHVAAGVAGGLLALVLADTVRPQLGLGGPSPSLVADLEKRLSATEQAVRNPPAASATPNPAVVQKLADLESRLQRVDDLGRAVGQLSESQARLSTEAKGLEQKVGQGQPGAETEQRVAKLEQTLATLSAAAGSDQSGGRIPQLAAITGKLADLEASLPNKLAELQKTINEALEARVAQTAEASEAARSATLRMDKELATSRAEVARLAQRAEAFKAADDRLEQSLRAVQEEAGSIRSAVDGLRNDIAAQLKTVARSQDVATAVAPVTERLGSLEQNLQGVVKSEDDRKANAERIVLALELGNLKRALDRGGSYAPELAEVARVSGGKIDLSVLERYKDQGVPTLPELSRSFRPVANAVIDSASIPADASALDRLLLSAKSVVRVRRTDHRPDDNSVEAIVARMEKSLADGKLTDVVAEARKIPLPTRDPAEAWLARVEARAAVDQAIAAVEDQLKSSLSGKAPAEKRTQ